jgi:uncharacterized protein (TIGR03435 family)
MPATQTEHMARTAARLLLTLVLTPIAAHSQPAPPASLPQFDVAIIKPIDGTHGPIDAHMPKVYPGGRIVIAGLSLKGLISVAFNASGDRLSGGEDWTSKDQYYLDARPPQTSPPTEYDTSRSSFAITDPRLREMLQALLIDRFQLKFHRETKQGIVYLLQQSGKPLLLHPTKADIDKQPSKSENEDSTGRITVGADHTWRIYDVSMAHFAGFIQDINVHHPVIDQTGLSGYFDAEWPQTLTDTQVYDGFGSLPIFVQALGLKLTKSSGPVESFVIDHAEHPSPN